METVKSIWMSFNNLTRFVASESMKNVESLRLQNNRMEELYADWLIDAMLHENGAYDSCGTAKNNTTKFLFPGVKKADELIGKEDVYIQNNSEYSVYVFIFDDYKNGMVYSQLFKKGETIHLKLTTGNNLLFVAGINTGLRISDLLKLRVVDVKDKSHIEFREAKTSKNKRFYINPILREYFDNYIQNMTSEQFLFASRKGFNKPITRVQAYKIINDAVKATGLCDKIGTHTLRKTFGYWHYQQFKDTAVLQDIFNHSAPSVTLRYIGINDDMKDKTISEFSL
jgi:hypothetical protein